MLISARGIRARIPRVSVRTRLGHPTACGDANLAKNVPSLIKNREEIEREQKNRRCSRASPLCCAQWQTRAECARRAYFHQFCVSRGTVRSYFIDDLSASRARKRKCSAIKSETHRESCILGTKSRACVCVCVCACARARARERERERERRL